MAWVVSWETSNRGGVSRKVPTRAAGEAKARSLVRGGAHSAGLFSLDPTTHRGKLVYECVRGSGSSSQLLSCKIHDSGGLMGTRRRRRRKARR